MNSHRPSGPPGVSSGRLGHNPAGRRKRKNASADYHSSSRSSTYYQVLVERYAERLLAPFRCYRCGAQHLDVLGWEGPRKPLCWRCAA